MKYFNLIDLVDKRWYFLINYIHYKREMTSWTSEQPVITPVDNDNRKIPPLSSIIYTKAPFRVQKWHVKTFIHVDGSFDNYEQSFIQKLNYLKWCIKKERTLEQKRKYICHRHRRQQQNQSQYQNYSGN